MTSSFEETMRNQHSGHRSIRTLHLALVASLLVIVTPIVGASPVATAATATPWTASGPPATFTLDSDGSVTPPQMTYNLGTDPRTATRFGDQTWTLSTTATSDLTDSVPYFYTGLPRLLRR